MKYPFDDASETMFGWFKISDKRGKELAEACFEVLDTPKKTKGECITEIMRTIPQTYEEMLICLYFIGVDTGRFAAMSMMNNVLDKSIAKVKDISRLKEISEELEELKSASKKDPFGGMGNIDKKKVIN